jgi:hypothetical protein
MFNITNVGADWIRPLIKCASNKAKARGLRRGELHSPID